MKQLVWNELRKIVFLQYLYREMLQVRRNGIWDIKWYLKTGIRIAKTAVHLLRYLYITGKYDGFLERDYRKFVDTFDWSRFLPSLQSITPTTSIKLPTVDVVIPVYRGLEQTRRCVESVLKSQNKNSYRVIIINDCSPESVVTNYLRSLKTSENLILIENSKNLGFTETVNIGMSQSEDNDVILLNSDTEVSGDWIDKLILHAYSTERVATVTPFSNNATICNYPNLLGLKKLPEGESTESLDKAFKAANLGRNIEIPTAVGSCMYIRRSCIKEIGLFDVEAFGRGYGEENDFCLRATHRGWKHLLAGDTFVFHEGEVSFKEESNARKINAMNVIRSRYPNYEKAVREHILKNEALSLRVAATAARFKTSNLPIVLHILHPFGGGTEKQVEEICLRQNNSAKHIIMTPGLKLRSPISAKSEDVFEVQLPVENTNIDSFIALLKSFGITLIHIHHLMGFQFDLKTIIDQLDVPFYLTLHDYFLVCPRVNLMPIGKDYCGEPDVIQCNSCIAYDYPQGASDIIWWRESHAWIFSEAQKVICPSKDVLNRFKKYYDKANYIIVGHEKDLVFDKKIIVPDLDVNKGESLRVAILGVLARHKGLDFLNEVLPLIKDKKTAINIKLIGYVEGKIVTSPQELFSQTGKYEENNLQKLIEEYNPHLILFPVRCPETYSYTLTAALKSRRPLMISNLGALMERVVDRDWTWTIPADITADQLIEKLIEIRESNFGRSVEPLPKPQLPAFAAVSSSSDINFYESSYFKHLEKVEEKINALVLIEEIGDSPSLCAYIRLMFPLFREFDEKFVIKWVTPRDVIKYKADYLICQRTVSTEIKTLDEIVNYCEKNQILIVYDLDDLLLALPKEHPHHAVFTPKSATVFRWLMAADQVWTSTDSLKKQLLSINPNIQTIPNYIDSKVWSKKSELPNVSNGVTRILYMGTHTHLPDFKMIENALQRLKTEMGNSLEICLVGIDNITSNIDWCKTISIPLMVLRTHPAFVNWLTHLHNKEPFHIGIAPLIDNEFNRSKSSIKFLDYSALGITTVASDIGVYSQIVNGENGILVKNEEESWYLALKDLIQNSEKRKKIQTRAHNDVFDKYGYSSVAGLRKNSLLNLKKKIKHETISLVDKESSVDISRNLVASAYLTGEGIEVGALHNPLPVPSSIKVRYVDRMDKEGLYRQYPELRQYKLVDIDYIDNGESLSTFTENSQDFIIANHFLEHCEDPIATLKSFFRVLKENGVIYLALPDKRTTFDCNRKNTTLEHLIKDHVEGPLSSRFDHYKEWPQFVEPHFGRTYATEVEIEKRAKELMDLHYSVHFHAWEPQDVFEMLKYCRDVQKIPLFIDFFISKNDEMLIILRKKV
ncbi:MAG: glycosyltransferase [Bacteriovoracaceae bacterium]